MSTTIIVERDVQARMRDGTILRADIYRHDTIERLPVLLQRTPYGKGFSQTSFAFMAAERGYAVIIQDTRGRWASDGLNYPMIFEKEDGYDTVEWAASQPWSNGKVGMFGGSYVGYTQYAAAASQPPSLKTIVPFVTFCNPYQLAFMGGALNLGSMIAWGLLHIAQMDILRAPLSDPEKSGLWAMFVGMVDGMSQGKTFSVLPLLDLPLIGQNGITPFFRDLLQHPALDDLWKSLIVPYENIDIPVYHFGGWYDTFIGNTVTDFNSLRLSGGTDLARSNQKLLIGPWTHGNFDNLSGEADFGIQSSGLLIFPDEIHLRWFDYWLKGIQNGIMDEPRVRIFVMGDNQWRDEQEWPLARTEYVSYYLHSSGNANTLNGDGSLSQEKPANEPADRFVYDPNNPVPTHGGAVLGWEAALPSGVYDQRNIESRRDVLVFTTPPLERDLEITGPLQVRLWAVSDSPDTDFTVKLVDVEPGGYARNIQDGIIRASRRDATGLPAPIQPDTAYPYTIEMGATSNVFKSGHKLRLEVSSSNFPRFDRNPNTGKSLTTDLEMHPARQTILHDLEHPSHIILPIIPRG
jgi:putative CocE/NonD family hydrolase